MKKLAIFMTLVLALSTAVLANPIFQDRGNEASNALYQKIGGGDCDDEDRCVRPGKVALTVQTWIDDDSDGDGISDGIEMSGSETLATNKGQIASAIKSERKPKFKAGAELSKTVNSLDTGDLDGDGFGDIAISAERTGDTVTVKATSIDKRSARTGLYQTENHMNKAELIEAMASHAGLSKADSKKALDTVGEIILGEDRDMVMPGDNIQ